MQADPLRSAVTRRPNPARSAPAAPADQQLFEFQCRHCHERVTPAGDGVWRDGKGRATHLNSAGHGRGPHEPSPVTP